MSDVSCWGSRINPISSVGCRIVAVQRRSLVGRVIPDMARASARAPRRGLCWSIRAAAAASSACRRDTATARSSSVSRWAAARSAADGWGGDVYVAYGLDERTCVRAAFAGDTAADTDEIAQAQVAHHPSHGASDASIVRASAGMRHVVAQFAVGA